MPKSSRQSVTAFSSPRIDELGSLFQSQKDLSVLEIEGRLIHFGLEPYEIDLIISRVCESKEMLQIVAEQHWLSLNSANYYLRKALKKLRDGGFHL